MNFKATVRKLFFKSIDAELSYNKQAINLLLESNKLMERENAAQSKILLSYLETFQSLKRDEGLTTSFNEKIVVKYNTKRRKKVNEMWNQ